MDMMWPDCSVYRTVLLNVPPMLLIVSCACLTGLVVYAYFASIGCDPLASGQVKIGNEVGIQKLYTPMLIFQDIFNHDILIVVLVT